MLVRGGCYRGVFRGGDEVLGVLPARAESLFYECKVPDICAWWVACSFVQHSSFQVTKAELIFKVSVGMCER